MNDSVIISRPKGGLIHLPAVLCTLLCFILAASGPPGGGDGGWVNLPGGGGEKVCTARVQFVGGYVLVQAAEQQPVVVYVAATGTPIGTMPNWPTAGGETTITSGPWTCSCHNIPHTVTTKITTTYMKSDMEKHDRKLNGELRRHPPQ